LSSGELRKGGAKLKIQPQPFNVLSYLLRRHGEVVSRHELQQTLWPHDTYVEFNASLNAAIKKLRRVILDDPRNPRYIETLPRTGYRFSYPIEWIDVPAQAREDHAGRPIGTPSVSQQFPQLQKDQNPGLRTQTVSETAQPSQRRQAVIGWLVALLLGVALLAVGYLSLTAPAPERVVRRYGLSAGVGAGSAGGVISPDGRHVLYPVETDGRRRLMLRSLAVEEARELPGTAGAVGGFWAPDSRSVGFATQQSLRAVSLAGLEALTLCDLPDADIPFGGGSWSPDGQRIVFSSGALLYEVSAQGGEPKLLFERGDSVRPNFTDPYFLPSGSAQALVYTAAVSPFDQVLAVMDLKTGERRTLGPGSAPVYSPDGHLVYGPANRDDRGLMALPFSLKTLTPTGSGFAINEKGTKPSVSSDGTLVYAESPSTPLQMVWRDRQGKLLETIGSPQPGVRQPALSRTGRLIAATSRESGDSDIWIVGTEGGRSTQLTSDPGIDDGATWSPDGTRVAFSRQGRTGEGGSILTKAVTGEGEAALVIAASGRIANPEWSLDGRYLVYSDYSGGPRSDIRYLEFHDGVPSEPRTFLGSHANEYSPKFFPSVGRFLTYVSNQTGRDEVYIARFPEATDVQKVSLNGGRRARWRSDGAEVYYVEGATLVAAPVSVTEQGLKLGRPQRLFESADLKTAGYAPSADGRRFVTVSPAEGSPEHGTTVTLHVTENWFQEFRDKNP
jgi:Tol biopolymer transport system component/DNA-binding winged helix-turn-helix (wHTH) protein